MKICQKKFKNFDYTDCKISTFKVEKSSLFAHSGTRLYDFEHA